MQCPCCGQNIGEGAKYCPYCGTVFNDAQSPEDSERKKSNKKLILIIVSAALAFLLAAAGVLYALDRFGVIDIPFIGESDTEEASERARDKNDKKDGEENGKNGSIAVHNNEAPKVKVGFIYLHDENSTYDLNFINAAKEACDNLGVEYINKTNIPENDDCLSVCKDLVESGCTIIFGNSYGFESYMLDAAKMYPEVQFCHAGGVMARNERLANFHNAYAADYQGRYLTGVAAGMKLNEMIADGLFSANEAKIGFVGTYTYAEVISRYTAFYLGAKSVCPTVTMDVQFTGSWYSEIDEKEVATQLINSGCKLISQDADSMGAPTACEAAGVPNITSNGSTAAACPNTFIVSSKIDWRPYFEYIIRCVRSGNSIDTDWTGSLSTASIALSDVNTRAAAYGTTEKIIEVKGKLQDGEIEVFDTNTFTVNGKRVTSYLADVNFDYDFTRDTEVIKDGAFKESYFRSAPYFDMQIDGITLMNTNYG